jgi:hypothetical protein
MKKALVCPNEPVQNGYRVAQVEPAENIFGVAEPLYWLDCNDDVVADQWYYDTTDKTIKEVPKPVVQPTTTGSQTP